jgi:hypothetical protein
LAQDGMRCCATREAMSNLPLRKESQIEHRTILVLTLLWVYPKPKGTKIPLWWWLIDFQRWPILSLATKLLMHLMLLNCISGMSSFMAFPKQSLSIVIPSLLVIFGVHFGESLELSSNSALHTILKQMVKLKLLIEVSETS